MSGVGIIQGRLSPPVNGRLQTFPNRTWAEEFESAQAAGLEYLEWVYGLAGARANPLGSVGGVARIKRLSQHFRIQVRSVCADYFVDRPLVRGPEAVRTARRATLRWLLRQCATGGIKWLVLPFVDRSEIRTDEELERVARALRAEEAVARRLGVELHLETSLPPHRFGALLNQLDGRTVKVTYDIGNSAALGYNPRAEFAVYGDRIGSVHVKDRLRNGPSVPLGEGAAKFSTCFALLKALGYRGDFTLQVARGQSGEELAWARRNRDFVESHWAHAVQRS